MKSKILFPAFLILSGLLSCNQANTTDADLIENSSTASDPKAKGKEPIMTFDSESFDFGNIVEGEVVEHDFNFTNTGNKTLLISDVQVTCGCTVPKWPREPIKSGQGGVIKIQFNSANKHEKIDKEVTIISNANPVKKKLAFSAFVSKKPGAE